VACRIALQEGHSLAAVEARIDKALRSRFGPAPEPVQAPAELRPFGRMLYVTELIDVLGGVKGADWVDHFEVRRLSARASAGDEAEDKVGLRIGMVASIGADTCLGGRASVPVRRFLRDEVGEVISIHVQPWEILRVRIAKEGLFAVPSQERRR
jgi:hypothetical protein